MGNTIRREPVNFSIPASPDYKFLNITNFRGLDVSSNPFELATNTASDCLNVYVDETNTLTTRPRLEKKELKDSDGKDVLPLTGRCVGIYPLHDGYLFHWSHKMKILHGDKLTDVLVEKMPLTPCKCFEQGDKIYLLGEGRYMLIDENGILNDVEGYVPNRSIVRLDGTVEKDESLNILTNMFTEKYYWDGVSDPHIPTNVSSVENKYYKKPEVTLVLGGKKPLAITQNKLMLYADEGLEKNVGVYNFDPEFTGNRNIADTVHSFDVTEEEIASGGKDTNFWLYHYNPYGNSLYFYMLQNNDFEYGYYDVNKLNLNNKNYWRLSPNGNYLLTDAADGNTYLFRAVVDSVTDEIKISKATITFPQHTGHTQVSSKIILSNTKIWYVVLLDGKPLVYWSSLENIKFNKFDEIQDINLLDIDFNIGVTDNDEYLWIDNFDTFVLYKQTNVNSRTIQIKSHQDKIHINSDGFAWTTPKWTQKNVPVKINTIPDLSNINDRYFVDVLETKTSEQISNSAADDFCVFYRNNFFYYKFDIDKSDYAQTSRSVLYFWNNSNEPNITTTSLLTESDELYDVWSKLNKQIRKTSLETRFDNNYWLASGNTYFRSQNNDPTYFPITEYSELGDGNEDITGFNIANDTTLLAYKPSRLYLIQPFYSETTGMTEYSKTESKNTVGNTAIDAPIVTTLTEIPLQINNDGVYGLSQVSNVSAVERIADLISEPINDRWLNEDDEVIKKAQTLNRLYWTYIILPYEKLTKVYLLDNRTNSWYYWELPIELLNAFVKDNHAEFVDTDGNIYYLTTTDIRNMGFDTQLVTEYYDYGKKLIPWHWQSQVLYLGTMNHAKRLVNTTFILTDTDTQDGYGLQYSFKVFRKLASSVPEKELSGDLNLVRSTTKKTNISKFGFLQLKLSNITEDSQGTEAEKAYRNNKLRLVGLGLKYVLLEGLIR